MTGKETAPMTTFWAVYTAMCEKILDPIYATITIEMDMEARRATCQAEGVLAGRGEPILNPVTKAEHRVESCCRTASNTGRTRWVAAGRHHQKACH